MQLPTVGKRCDDDRNGVLYRIALKHIIEHYNIGQEDADHAAAAINGQTHPTQWNNCTKTERCGR